MSELTNLIIVPGHAVPCVKTRDETCNPLAWLGTYAGYRYGEEILQYLRHIQRGVDLAVRDPTSLLVFSGGRTRQGTSTSEASGYRSVAELWDWWGHGKCVSHRADLEEFATDSFENLLFSILLFEHRTGMFPSLVTVVGLRFKQRRFVTHAKAIISARYCHVPAFFFTYDDINDLPDYLLDE